VVSINLVVEVLENYHGNPRHKLWLVALAEVANDQTRAGWPSRRLLADRADVSPSRASSIASELVAEGVIKRDGGGRRGHGSTRYVLGPLNNGVRQPRTLSDGSDDYPF
jgi:hypothetical protein